MSRKELLMTQINSLPDSVVEKVLEFVAFQRYSLGLFDNDTDYLNSIPGMAESIVRGMKTPVHECFDALE
jgi:hypothetical protein